MSYREVWRESAWVKDYEFVLENTHHALTVGDLRQLIDGLADETLLAVDVSDGVGGTLRLGVVLAARGWTGPLVFVHEEPDLPF